MNDGRAFADQFDSLVYRVDGYQECLVSNMLPDYELIFSAGSVQILDPYVLSSILH